MEMVPLPGGQRYVRRYYDEVITVLLRARDEWRRKARAAAVSSHCVVPATLVVVLEPDFRIPFP